MPRSSSPSKVQPGNWSQDAKRCLQKRTYNEIYSRLLLLSTGKYTLLQSERNCISLPFMKGLKEETFDLREIRRPDCCVPKIALITTKTSGIPLFGWIRLKFNHMDKVTVQIKHSRCFGVTWNLLVCVLVGDYIYACITFLVTINHKIIHLYWKNSCTTDIGHVIICILTFKVWFAVFINICSFIVEHMYEYLRM